MPDTPNFFELYREHPNAPLLVRESESKAVWCILLGGNTEMERGRLLLETLNKACAIGLVKPEGITIGWKS